MAEKFEWKKFTEVDINDPFFDSLKRDYTEFCEWFQRKGNNEESALVYYDSQGVAAFIYLKRENEPITLSDRILPSKQRLKIGTLKLSERIRSQRLGEGALGVALWYWQQVEYEEVYVTAFDKHTELISLLERFGLKMVGQNNRGESVFIKNRNSLDFSNPYKCFPFLSNNFESAGLIPIEDVYHDKLFPYSELFGNDRNIEEITAGNGITKVYIASPMQNIVYKVGMPVFAYRKFTGVGQKAFKSVITSLCTVNKLTTIKYNGVPRVSFDEFVTIAGNKTVYPEEELRTIFHTKQNIVAIELVYNTYFGKGHNVNYATLKDNGLFEAYPYQITYNMNELKRILELGGRDVQNIIID